MRRRPAAILFSFALVAGATLWWFFGSDLSEQTAYRLAAERAETYAAQNQIDLGQYTPPTVGNQGGSRVYTFSWKPKSAEGKPLTVTVDAMTVEVSVIESPTWNR